MSSHHGQYPSQFSATPAQYCGMHTSGGVNPSFPHDAFSSQHSSPLLGSGYPLEVHRTTTRRYTTPDGRHVEETVSVVERVPTPDLMPGQWSNVTHPETQNGWPYGAHEYEYRPRAPAPTEPPSDDSSNSERQSLSPDALLLQPYVPSAPSGYLAGDSSEPAPTYVAPEFSASSPQSSGSSVAFSGPSSGPPADRSFWDTPAGARLSAMNGETLADSFLGDACGYDAQSYRPALAISQEQYAYAESSAQYGSADQNATNFAHQQQLGWNTAVATASLGGWHSSLSSPSSAAAEPGPYPPPPQFSHTYDSHASGINQGSMSYASHTPSSAPTQFCQHPTQSVEGRHTSYSHALTTAEATNWIPGAHDAHSTVGAEAEKIGDDDECDEYDDYSEDESGSDGGCDASNVGGAPEQYIDDSSRNSISDQHTWSVEKSASSHGGPLQFTSETLTDACEHGVPRGAYCSDCRLYYELFGSYMSRS